MPSTCSSTRQAAEQAVHSGKHGEDRQDKQASTPSTFPSVCQAAHAPLNTVGGAAGLLEGGTGRSGLVACPVCCTAGTLRGSPQGETEGASYPRSDAQPGEGSFREGLAAGPERKGSSGGPLGAVAGVHGVAGLAFGGGRYRCPGRRFAEMEVGLLTALLLSSCELELGSDSTHSTSQPGVKCLFSERVEDLKGSGAHWTEGGKEPADLIKKPQTLMQNYASEGLREGASNVELERIEEPAHKGLPDGGTCETCKGGGTGRGCEDLPKCELRSDGAAMSSSSADGASKHLAHCSQISWWHPLIRLWEHLPHDWRSGQPRPNGWGSQAQARCWTSLPGSPGDPAGLLPLPETRRQVGIRWPQGPCPVLIRPRWTEGGRAV
eukprot:jgi/Botrbrau1/12270/Bobra.0323s0010.1